MMEVASSFETSAMTYQIMEYYISEESNPLEWFHAESKSTLRRRIYSKDLPVVF
jgi:hypothetical protein